MLMLLISIYLVIYSYFVGICGFGFSLKTNPPSRLSRPQMSLDNLSLI